MVVTDTLVMAPRRIDGPVRLVVPGVAGAEPTVSSRRNSPGPTQARRPGRHFVTGGSDTRRRGRTAPVLGLGAAPVVPEGARILAPHNMPALYARIDGLRHDPRVAVQEIGAVQGHPMHALRITDPSDGPKLKVLITAGVHGNEPCGPGAAMLMIDQLLADPKLLQGLDVTVLPALNPRGLINKSRRTPEDVDLNRVYGTDGAPEEARIAAGYLTGQRYDLAMDLHSGAKKRNGFWALHRNAADLLTPALRNLGQRWPLLSGDTKPYTMTSPGVGTSKNRSTLKDFIFNEGTPRTATLEAPGSVDYLQQVLGENAMMHSIVAELRKAAEQGQAGVA